MIQPCDSVLGETPLCDCVLGETPLCGRVLGETPFCGRVLGETPLGDSVQNLFGTRNGSKCYLKKPSCDVAVNSR